MIIKKKIQSKTKKRLFPVFLSFMLCFHFIYIFSGVYATNEPTSEPVTTTIPNIYDESRYNPYSPQYQVSDSGVSGIVSSARELIKTIINSTFSQESPSDSIIDWMLDPDKGSNLTEAVKAQRVIDLKEYANQSTTGSIPDSFAFTAKRRLYYPNGLYETDTMYYWYSYDTTLHTPSSLEGVQIGDFFLQPNTFVVFRYFSNGDSSCFYGNALDFPLTTYTDKTTQYKVEKVNGKTYSVINQDGVIESVTPKNGYTLHPIIQFKSCGKNADNEYVNNITTNALYNIANNYPDRYTPFMSTDRIFTNIECMMSNAFKSDGTPMFTASNTYDRYFPQYVWYLSSGCYFGTNRIGTNSIDDVFNRDPDNTVPYKAPIYYNLNDPLSSPQIPTQQTVNNYYDYGITYNDDNDEFELDLDTLLGALAPSIQPTLEPTFDGTFELQPDIGGSFSGTLDNNYLDLGNEFILDLLSQLPVPEGWQEPSFPAITTYGIVISPTFPTTVTTPDYLPTATSSFYSFADRMLSSDILVILLGLALFGICCGILM